MSALLPSRVPGMRLDRRRTEAARGAAVGTAAPRVGVLALQGDVLEHIEALAAVGLHPVPVRRPAELEGLDGIVLPGGESTAISRALGRGGLAAPLQELIASGVPVLATCAGLILLADELVDHDDLPRPGGLAVRVRRNAYGPQTASFDVAVDVAGMEGGPMHASFIRAPRIEAVLSEDVEVLARIDGHPVAVRQGPVLAMTFHPEVAGDVRMHALLASSVHDRGAR